MISDKKESLYIKFIDYLFFNWLKSDFFPGIIFSSDDLKQRRKAALKGISLPVVALWRTGIPLFTPENYGHSVLKRTLSVDDRYVSCQVCTFSIKYNIYTEAYFLDYVNQVVEKLIKINIQRYFQMDMTNILSGFKNQRIEFKLTDGDYTPATDEDKEQRRFYVNCGFDTAITIPLITDQFFLEKLELLIYPVDYPV
jgi:hypothetical protein